MQVSVSREALDHCRQGMRAASVDQAEAGQVNQYGSGDGLEGRISMVGERVSHARVEITGCPQHAHPLRRSASTRK